MRPRPTIVEVMVGATVMAVVISIVVTFTCPWATGAGDSEAGDSEITRSGKFEMELIDHGWLQPTIKLLRNTETGQEYIIASDSKGIAITCVPSKAPEFTAPE